MIPECHPREGSDLAPFRTATRVRVLGSQATSATHSREDSQMCLTDQLCLNCGMIARLTALPIKVDECDKALFDLRRLCPACLRLYDCVTAE